MTGNSNMSGNAALPLNARNARIASGGGLAASLHGLPAAEESAPNGYLHTGAEPDGLDSDMTGRRVEACGAPVRPAAPFGLETQQRYSS